MSSNFVPRGAWGGKYPVQTHLGQVDTVVIHHTAAPGNPQLLDAARARRIEMSEINNGYSSLAYHFLIQGGNILEARGWGIKGAATGGYDWNSRSVAICIDGYFHPPRNETPSEAALDAAADTIVLGVYLGFINRNFRVITHGEASAGTKYATACPGDNLRGLVNGFGSIAARAQYKLQNAPPGPIAPATGPPAPPRCVKVASKRTLRKGNKGALVTTLQRLLLARGFNPGPIDGIFGQRVENAVRCAQKANNITVDGIVGPQTWRVLGG